MILLGKFYQFFFDFVGDSGINRGICIFNSHAKSIAKDAQNTIKSCR